MSEGSPYGASDILRIVIFGSLSILTTCELLCESASRNAPTR